MRGIFWDDYGPTGFGFILATIVVLAACFGGCWAVNAKSCTDTGALYGVHAEYGLFTDCNVIDANGKAITSMEKWQTTHVTVDGSAS